MLKGILFLSDPCYVVHVQASKYVQKTLSQYIQAHASMLIVTLSIIADTGFTEQLARPCWLRYCSLRQVVEILSTIAASQL